MATNEGSAEGRAEGRAADEEDVFGAPASKAELEAALVEMNTIVSGFYFQAVNLKPLHVHQFVEFAGFMREWLKLCREGLEQGHDYTGFSPVPSNTMKPYHARYLGEKFGCIFDDLFAARPALVDAFCKAAFGISLSSMAATLQWITQRVLEIENASGEASTRAQLADLRQSLMMLSGLREVPRDDIDEDTLADAAPAPFDEQKETKEQDDGRISTREEVEDR